MALSTELLERAAAALRYKAHSDAGHSQAPHLFTEDETQEWEDAKAIMGFLAGRKKRSKEKERKNGS